MRLCTIPPHKEPKLLQLTLSVTRACSPADVLFTADFAVVHHPTVIGVKPSFGVSAGGSIITVGGQHFTMSPGSRMECVFDEGATVEAMVISSEEVLCVLPAHEHGEVSLTLIARGSTAWQSASMSFWYEQPLAVTSFWPSRGVVSEDLTITVAGKTFSSNRSTWQQRCDRGWQRLQVKLERWTFLPLWVPACRAWTAGVESFH